MNFLKQYLPILILIAIVATFAAGQNRSPFDVTRPYGEMYVSSGAATSTTSGTPVKMNGTTTLDDALLMDMPANNRLRYTGTKGAVFFCSVNTSMGVDANTIELLIYMAKNGTVDLTTAMDREIATINDHGSMGTNALITLNENDYVELFVDSEAGNAAVTVDHMRFTCIMQY